MTAVRPTDEVDVIPTDAEEVSTQLLQGDLTAGHTDCEALLLMLDSGIEPVLALWHVDDFGILVFWIGLSRFGDWPCLSLLPALVLLDGGSQSNGSARRTLDRKSGLKIASATSWTTPRTIDSVCRKLPVPCLSSHEV